MRATFDKIVVNFVCSDSTPNYSLYQSAADHLILPACPGYWLWSWLGPDWDVASCSFKSKCWILQVDSPRFALLLFIKTDFLYWSQLSTTCAAIQNAFISFIKNWFLRIHHLLQVVRCLRWWSDCLLRVAPCPLWWSWKSCCHHPCLCCHGPVAEVAISYISNFNPIHLLANPTIWCSLLGNFWLLDSW